MITVQQIRAHVEALAERAPEAMAFALSVATRWTGPREVQVGARKFRIVPSNSELEIRDALVTAEQSGTPVVLLTRLKDSDLGEDVCARLGRRHVIPLSGSELLRHLFRARDIEPRLRNQLWLAEALVEAQPPGGYPPVPGGRLDEDTALDAFLRQVMGFDVGRPDLADVLHWARRGDAPRRLGGLSPEVSRRFEEWITRTAGAAVSLVLSGLQIQQPASPVALALACGLVFRGDADHALVAARGRLEHYFGGKTPGNREALQLEEAGIRCLDRDVTLGHAEAVRREQEHFDGLLAALRISEYAIHSDHSLAGLELRFGALAESLRQFASTLDPSLLGVMDRQVAALGAHRNRSQFSDRCERAAMAVRLCRWLSTPAEAPAGNLAVLAERYRVEESYVDWARDCLHHGDSLAALNRAYGELLRRALERREILNAAFARALIQANQQGDTLGILGVEDVIPRLVAPLTTRAVRVLFLVIDGLSFPVFHELGRSIETLGFLSLSPAGNTTNRKALAGLPTITEWSRRLLLGGRDGAVGSQGEKLIFASHPALSHLGGGRGPELFLKGDLTQTGDVGLADGVRSSLLGESAVVGIVVNAVDDHLLKGDQLHVPWTLDRMPLLQQILTTAAQADRVVVLTADHGHVVENDSTTEKHEGGDRYRLDAAPPGPAELEVLGGRIPPLAKGRFVAPWTEQLIYTSKKNGYHGGLTPQEVLVPVVAMAQEHQVPEGWTMLADPIPPWWHETVSQSPRALPPRPAAAQPDALLDLPLFQQRSEASPQEGPAWMDALVRSELFKHQQQIAGRVAPSVDLTLRILQALDERQGVMLVGSLAGRIGMPEMRMAGLLTGLRRVLNVEGYAVLSVDEASATVRLNYDLLRTQFDLPSS